GNIPLARSGERVGVRGRCGGLGSDQISSRPMPVLSPLHLPELLSPRSRLLGLDLGAKTIGLAISDPGLTVASPIETIRRGKRRAEVVDKMAAAYILQGALDAMPHSPSPPPQRGRGLE